MFTSIVVRSCIAADIPRLCSIERSCFEEDSGYSIEEFQLIYDKQKAKQKAIGSGDLIRVAELSVDGGAPVIAGYLHLHKTIFRDETTRTLSMEVISVAVDPIYRRMEVGTRLVESVFALGDFFKTSTTDYSVDAFVPDTSLPAQLFFKHLGFVCTAIEEPTPDDIDPITYYLFELTPSRTSSTAGRSDASKNR